MATISEVDELIKKFQSVIETDNNVLSYKDLNDILTSMLPFSLSNTFSFELPVSFMKSLEVVCEHALQDGNIDFDICLYLTNFYRLCRNVCATCIKNQLQIQQSSKFIELTKCLLSILVTHEHKNDDVLLLMRCAVQFLGNYSSGNSKNQCEVWGNFQLIFRKCIEVCDIKLQEYVSMVIHLILSNCDKNTDIMLDETSWELLQTCIQIATNSESENSLLVVEDSLMISNFCSSEFHRLSLEARVLWLEVLLNALQRLPEDNNVSIDDTKARSDIPCIDNIFYIAADFISQSGYVPSMTSNEYNQSQIMCTVKELECLCVASSHYQLYGSIQDNDQLVHVAVSLLQCIEDVGKEGNNVFTNVDKVSRAGEVNSDHPVYGLKRDLIRLLGNMAHKHQHNQNLVRELDGIPLILNQTNIDGKNPFITQWSVFAIHNLTEENEDNRLYIANLKLEGVANNQAVLDEMGLQAVKENDKVVIKKKKLE
ncbi:Ataxin-10 [Mactra antiquata]